MSKNIVEFLSTQGKAQELVRGMKNIYMPSYFEEAIRNIQLYKGDDV